MLTIRNEQLDAFNGDVFIRFVDRVVQHLRKQFPDHTKALQDDALRALILEGTDKAEKYGIINELDVECYLEHILLYGPDFDTRIEGAKEILSDPELDGGTKMDMLDELTMLLGEG